MALLNSLRKLLSGTADKATGPATALPSRATSTRASRIPFPPPPAPSVGIDAPSPLAPPCGPLDPSPEWLLFSSQLLGAKRLKDVPPIAAEQTLMQRLQAQTPAQWAQQLPRLPALLPQLMRLARRDDVTAGELAQLMSRDPILVGELMKLANSPRYRPEREITDLQAAVMVLGQQGLDQMVMSVTLRPIFSQQKGRHGRRGGTLLWDLAERAAFATRPLATAGDDEFGAYLAGLSAPLGLMAMLRAMDAMPTLVPPLDREGLHRQLMSLSLGWSADIVRHWGFPAQVADALAPDAARGAEAAVLARLVQQALTVALRQLMQPGLVPAQLSDWTSSEQRAYAALEAEFNRPGAAPASMPAS